MSFNAAFIEYGFFILGGFLLLIALAHSITAWRFGARMPLTALTNGIFIVGVVAIVFLTWSMVSTVDWTGTFTLSLPAINIHF